MEPDAENIWAPAGGEPVISSKGRYVLMSIEFIYPEFEVIRSDSRCIGCRVCEQQCANGVHRYDAKKNILTEDETKCVNCQRCVSFCPTRALKT